MFSHCNPLRNAIRSVQLRHKEPSHADCIYIYYSRSHAVDRCIRNCASSLFLFLAPLFFLLRSFLFFCIFYSALNISRAKCAIHKRSHRMPTYVHRYTAISSARQDMLAQYLPSPSCDHSRNCSLSSVIKLTRLPDHVALVRKSRPREVQLLTSSNFNNSSCEDDLDLKLTF